MITNPPYQSNFKNATFFISDSCRLGFFSVDEKFLELEDTEIKLMETPNHLVYKVRNVMMNNANRAVLICMILQSTFFYAKLPQDASVEDIYNVLDDKYVPVSSEYAPAILKYANRGTACLIRHLCSERSITPFEAVYVISEENTKFAQMSFNNVFLGVFRQLWDAFLLSHTPRFSPNSYYSPVVINRYCDPETIDKIVFKSTVNWRYFERLKIYNARDLEAKKKKEQQIEEEKDDLSTDSWQQVVSISSSSKDTMERKID